MEKVIREIIFNPVQTGKTLTFRAINLHYTKVTLRGTESGVIRLKKCTITTTGPGIQVAMGPFGSVSWIFCKYRGTSLDKPGLFQIVNLLM